MKRLLGVLTMGWLGLAGADGAVLLEFVPSASPVLVTPGETFEFSVRLTVGNGDAVVGFDYYLLAAGVNYQNGFSILSRNSDLTYFPELNTSDFEVVNPAADAVLGSTNVRSLGAAVSDVLSPVTGTSVFPIATFVIAVAPDAAQGSFTISSAFASWLDQDFVEQTFSSPASIAIQVVPEPAICPMVMGGMMLWALLRWRRPAPSCTLRWSE